MYNQTRRPIRNDPLHPEGIELQAVAIGSAAGASENSHCGSTGNGHFIPTVADLAGHQSGGVIETAEDGGASDDSSSENHEG